MGGGIFCTFAIMTRTLSQHQARTHMVQICSVCDSVLLSFTHNYVKSVEYAVLSSCTVTSPLIEYFRWSVEASPVLTDQETGTTDALISKLNPIYFCLNYLFHLSERTSFSCIIY